MICLHSELESLSTICTLENVGYKLIGPLLILQKRNKRDAALGHSKNAGLYQFIELSDEIQIFPSTI
jgi:hypothetical protein